MSAKAKFSTKTAGPLAAAELEKANLTLTNGIDTWS